MQWRLDEVGDTKNVEWLMRKTAGREWSQPKKKIMCAGPCKVIEAGLANPFGAHDSLNLLQVLGMEVQDLMLALLGFDLVFFPVFLAPPPFEIRILILYHCC